MSSGIKGTLTRFLRIGQALTILSGATLTVNSGGAVVVDGGTLRLVPQANPPSGGLEGMIYMDTDHKLYVHNGTTWQVVGAQS